MNWFYLALLAPLLYSVVNLFDDNLLRLVYKSPYLATTFAGFFGTLPLLALIFRLPSIGLALALLSVLAGLLTVGYYFFYFRGLESDSPSIVVALFGFAPALLPVFAHLFLHEQLQTLQLVGFTVVFLASLGIAVVDVRQFKFSAALLPVVIGVVFMDAAALISKYVYENASFFSAYMLFCVGIGLGGVTFLLLRFSENKQGLNDIRKILRKVLPIFLVAELTGLAAEFTLNLAISRGPVSLVKVIEGIQPMFVLLLALLLYPLAPRFFREAEEGGVAKKFLLMAIAVVGLALISIATKA